MRRKHPFLLLFISLLVTTFFACKKTDEPTTAPTETESHSPQNADPKPESSDTQNPGAETNLLALEFLPNSTWFVATTRQPSKLTSLLDWERIEQRVPMHSPLLKSQFLTQLGLNLDGPAGFAMADLEQPGFLFFASRTPETGITKNPLPSLIAQSFPAAKTTAHGSQTQITLEATKDFPFCPCELVLTDKTLIALIHPY